MEEAPHQMPTTSRWPIMVAAGITLIIIGIITHWLVSLLGIAILIFALGGWTQENRDQAQMVTIIEEEQAHHE